jgi:hypothetical protein
MAGVMSPPSVKVTRYGDHFRSANIRSDMSRMRKIIPVFAAAMLASVVLVTAASAFTPPKDHEKLLKDEDYQHQFKRFSATLNEAKSRLSPAKYAELEEKIDEEMAESVKEDMATGSTEVEARSIAYMVGIELVGHELTVDWFRENATGVQGYYKLKSDAFDGYMTVKQGDEENFYGVYLYAIQKGNAENSGEVDGVGKIEGKKILVDFGGEEGQTVTVNFDGETATVETSKEFKDSGWLGNGVVLDGKYVREKK